MKLLSLGMALALVASTAIAQTVPPITPAVRALHQRLLTLDTHLDTPANFSRPGWDFAQEHSLATDFSQVDLPRMRIGGLDGGFFAIYTPQGPRTPEATRLARDAALLRAVEIRETVARLGDRTALATRADDAARIAKSGKVFVYQSIENAYPLSGDVTLLSAFYNFGVRLVGVAHFLNNDFGDSSTDPKGPEWHGLSPLGRRLVKEANRLGVILDASHSSDDVLDQLLDLSTTPIILSHSGLKAVYDHPRNIDDTRLRKLAAKGGVIQIDAFSTYVAAAEPNAERDAILARYPGSERSFDQFLAHILHALKVVGPDHVGIGIDWDGGGGVVGLRDVRDLPRITGALLATGYSEADIQKIWSGNVLRVLRVVEAAATAPNPER